MEVKADLEGLGGAIRERGFLVYVASVRRLPDNRWLVVLKRDRRKYIGLLSTTEPVMSFGTFIDRCELPGGYNLFLFELDLVGLRTLSQLGLIELRAPVETELSLGLGDRLGLVGSAQLKGITRSGVNAFPVLAQQSPRELGLTGRDFMQVLIDACMGALEYGWTGAIGADADHIKDMERLDEALRAGYTMFTVDVSDMLGGVEKLDEISDKLVKSWADKDIGGYILRESSLIESAYTYQRAMGFVREVWERISTLEVKALELSIDEGDIVTTPEAHLYVIEYLRASGVEVSTLAPKFPGQFHKAVDYQGDLEELRRAVEIHVAVINALGGGYKLSLHSGSDKFSVYPVFYELTEGKLHVKTSGTTWLQALKLIAKTEPDKFWKYYDLALEHVQESARRYKLELDRSLLAELRAELSPVEIFHHDQARQLLHVSYGVLLEKFKDEIYQILDEHEVEHYELVSSNIAKHLESFVRVGR